MLFFGGLIICHSLSVLAVGDRPSTLEVVRAVARTGGLVGGISYALNLLHFVRTTPETEEKSISILSSPDRRRAVRPGGLLSSVPGDRRHPAVPRTRNFFIRGGSRSPGPQPADTRFDRQQPSRYGLCSRLSFGMASKAIRRRPADKGTDKLMETAMPDSVTEPLLGNSAQGSKSDGYKPTTRPDLWDGKTHECLHWAHVVSDFITQSAQKIVNVISQLGSFLARLFGCSRAPQSSQNGQTMLINLSPLQEERLKFLRQRLNVSFDSSTAQHQDALKELWRLAYPDQQLPPLKSDQWKEMGWQNSDPATDFRSGGFMSLENLIYFARNYPDSFHRLLHKADGDRAEWEYPFAVAGVNISFTLVQMLDLQSGKRSSKASVCFVQLLEDDEMAFDNLFCLAFQMLDAQWLARRASYMKFNEVLKSTLGQLEQELITEGISSVRDMPSFMMLKR